MLDAWLLALTLSTIMAVIPVLVVAMTPVAGTVGATVGKALMFDRPRFEGAISNPRNSQSVAPFLNSVSGENSPILVPMFKAFAGTPAVMLRLVSNPGA